MTKKVVILGGGVAGLSAAHELSERGFVVQVFERKKVPGGKARSVEATKTYTLDGQLVSGVGTDGRRALPGEHGFRFFPRFYKHLPDTMSRIPYKNNRHGVADNLVDTTRLEFPLIGKPPIIAVDRFPRTIEEFKLNFHNVVAALDGDYGLSRSEIEFLP